MKSNFKVMGLAAAVASASWGLWSGNKNIRRHKKPVKECLTCGNPHQHNNAYCSADCCRAHTTGNSAGESDE